ncbi:glycosyltransferase family 4 protein [Thermoproteota archaeon]
MMKNRKKVLAICLGRIGGCVHYANAVINAIMARDDVECKAYISKYSFQKGIKNAEEILTYRNKWELLFATPFILPFLLLKTFITIRSKKIDTVYFPAFYYWNVFFIWAARLAKARVVYTEHDGLQHVGDEKPFENFFRSACIKRSDHLIFLTDFVRKRVKKEIGFKVPSSVIPHGIFSPPKLIRKRRKHKSRPDLLFLGRVNHYKGVDILLEAVKGIDPSLFNKLFVVGNSSVELESDIPNVVMVDRWVSEAEISKYLNRSDIMVLPYRSASQSGVISLGISSALPMVCTDVGGFSEQLIKNKHAVFCKPEDVKDLRRAILKMIKDKQLYEDISDNLFRLSNELRWKDIAERVSKVL